jgi:hypothetical protein
MLRTRQMRTSGNWYARRNSLVKGFRLLCYICICKEWPNIRAAFAPRLPGSIVFGFHIIVAQFPKRRKQYYRIFRKAGVVVAKLNCSP